MKAWSSNEIRWGPRGWLESNTEPARLWVGAPDILRGGSAMGIPPPAPFSMPAQKAKPHVSLLTLPIALRDKTVVAPNFEIWNGIKSG